MFNLPVYLSAPAIKIANLSITNDQIIEKVMQNFKGSNEEWKRIKVGISYIFKYCDTHIRYLGMEGEKRPIDYAVDVCRELCFLNEINPSQIDLLIYGGIYREYFEPATAMDIASGLGIKRISAFDVTDACAGLLQSLLVAASIMQTDTRIKYALCCTTDFPDEAINYDIQSFADLSVKSAGLTLGGGASAWLVSREALKNGGARLLEIQNTSIPESFSICKVPVGQRKFHSLSKEIFELGLENVPDEINNILTYIIHEHLRCLKIGTRMTQI
jgi:3-oxoacyl-[acyl-carrier-protein] synthase-3